MATLNVPYSFTNGTTANATEVNSNFAAVKSFAETALVQADGSVKAGVSALAVEVINLLVPAGTISPYVGSSSPTGWLLCDGSTVAGGQTLYPNLWAVLPAAFKSGSSIVLPNLKGRTVVGFDSSQAEFDAIGETGGAKTHTLTQAEMPVHNHGQDAHNHYLQLGGGIGNSTAGRFLYGDWNAGGSSTAHIVNTKVYDAAAWSNESYTTNATPAIHNAGSGSAHNNLQPYVVFNYIIKV